MSKWEMNAALAKRVMVAAITNSERGNDYILHRETMRALSAEGCRMYNPLGQLVTALRSTVKDEKDAAKVRAVLYFVSTVCSGAAHRLESYETQTSALMSSLHQLSDLGGDALVTRRDVKPEALSET